jgi:putative heme-binding domain-containing protein
VRDSILNLAAEQGSVTRGEAIYRRAALQCINCHAIGSGGGLVGPNLVSLGGAATPEYVLRSLIDPNDKLKEGYNTVRVLTVDGRVIQGIPAGGDADTLQLRTAEGVVVAIARGDIEEETNGQSLMPVGLVDSLTRDELADLTRFLTALGREPEYTVSTRQIVRSVETLVWGQEAHVKMNRTSIDAVATEDPAFQWRPLVSLVNGSLPVAEMDQYQPHREVPPASYVRFTVEVGGSGKLSLGMSQIEGVEMWVDGRPTPAEQATALDLAPGSHVIILGLNRREISAGFTVEVL